MKKKPSKSQLNLLISSEMKKGLRKVWVKDFADKTTFNGFICALLAYSLYMIEKYNESKKKNGRR